MQTLHIHVNPLVDGYFKKNAPYGYKPEGALLSQNSR
jgi:hypothetical protein